jgi:arsenate reductase (thioredoxin)
MLLILLKTQVGDEGGKQRLFTAARSSSRLLKNGAGRNLPGDEVLSMKTILFVCVHNSGRSQMAEAFFNHMAQGKYRAYSAGTQPGNKVNPVVVEAMLEVGIDISANKPRALTMEMIKKADKMITMGCGADAEAVCPARFIETEDWALEDPKGKSLEQVRKIRDRVKDKVINLLKELE